MIILWDAVEAQIVFVGGSKDLQLKDTIDIGLPEVDKFCQYPFEKEISAFCWASHDGSIIAIGYVDGDILFWRTSKLTSSKAQPTGENHKIVRLQLSAAERRLPVIVLHWCSHDSKYKGSNGRLFVYGGDEIGSEEVLTVSFYFSVAYYSVWNLWSCTCQIWLFNKGRG